MNIETEDIRMLNKRRQLELVIEIADYLTEWVESDEFRCMDFEESLSCIESYGVKLANPCDELVTNAIRHLDDVINFWNKEAIPETLELLGFTESEIKRYNQVRESVIWVQFGA